MLYEKCKVGKPFIQKSNGRQKVMIRYPDGKRTTMSYPKYLYETRSGKYLGKDETIDHLDSNRLNNTPENLKVKNRRAHAIEDVRRAASQRFTCPICGKEFVLSGSVLGKRYGLKTGVAGPFCGRSCVLSYAHKIRRGEIEPFPVRVITKEYYTLKSLFRENSCQI